MSRAHDFLQPRVVGSVRMQWFKWTAGRRGSFRRADTRSAEGPESGCVAGDACRWKAGIASPQVAFDACLVVVGARGPLAG